MRERERRVKKFNDRRRDMRGCEERETAKPGVKPGAKPGKPENEGLFVRDGGMKGVAGRLDIG